MVPAIPTGGEAPVDLEVLSRLLGNPAPETIGRMLKSYWDSEGGTPAALRKLADARDGAALAAAAHGAKGAAAFIGAQAAADLCLALERAARDEEWPKVTALMAQVENAYAAIGAFIAQNHAR